MDFGSRQDILTNGSAVMRETIKEKYMKKKKIHTKKSMLEIIASYWRGLDQHINTECGNHIGKWSRMDLVELHEKMGERDAYHDLLEEFGYFKK